MTEAALKSLCRSFTEANVAKLAGFATAVEGVHPEIQMRAISMLMDRGWGKPNQPTENKIEGKVEIVLRDIALELRKKKL
jgi:hypothetical protein